MYGRYTQELGVFAKEEAARLRESEQRRSVGDRSRTLDLLEYEKGRCAKCRSKFHKTVGAEERGAVSMEGNQTESVLLSTCFSGHIGF